MTPFQRATSLARALSFDGQEPRHFGAPAVTREPFQSGGFNGEVGRGASCNCHRITLIPHCHGTHTESAGHLTLQYRPLHEFVPLAPIPALLLTVLPVSAVAANETCKPAAHNSDELITRAGLLAAWTRGPHRPPKALLLRTNAAVSATNPPYLSLPAIIEIVARGIEHLVVDLPSIDRTQDEGRLSAHREFFGLPEGCVDLAKASRAHCTITELAQFPTCLDDGPCALQLQVLTWGGDAVPSRPLYLPPEAT
jgi:arylformamidase